MSTDEAKLNSIITTGNEDQKPVDPWQNPDDAIKEIRRSYQPV